ncbi:MAG: hypothetical protein FJ318_00570, partial [SAR202 cluster bacterium]|nr:hypothetical protein [SAR202 cluster bacterium]
MERYFQGATTKNPPARDGNRAAGRHRRVTIPANPLVDWREAARAIVPSAAPLPPWLAAADRRVFLYHRGATALAAAIAAVAGRAGAVAACAWVPGYIGDDAVAPLRALGHRLRFYPVTDALQPDWAWLETALQREAGPGALVLVDYFGMPTPASAARSFGDRHGLALIEAAAHLPSAVAGVADAVVLSPRKHFAIPVAACCSPRPRSRPTCRRLARRCPRPRRCGGWRGRRG